MFCLRKNMCVFVVFYFSVLKVGGLGDWLHSEVQRRSVITVLTGPDVEYLR